MNPVEWSQWWADLPADDPTTQAARQHGFVVATQRLRELGWSRSATRYRVRRGTWSAPAYGTVSPFRLSDGTDDLLALARRRHVVLATSGVLRRPDHVVTSRSAAIVHGLPTVRTPATAELLAPNVGGLGRQATHSYSALLTAASVQPWHGVLVTRVERTLVDLARHDRYDAIMAGDAALRYGLLDPDELAADVEEARGWPGVIGARDVLTLLDGRAESPLESAVRLALHDDGFPPPELQVWIGDDRVDLYWPEQRLVLEADGRLKYVRTFQGEQRDALWRDKQREGRLRGHDCTVERVIWSDVFGGWNRTSARLRTYFPELASPVGWSRIREN